MNGGVQLQLWLDRKQYDVAVMFALQSFGPLDCSNEDAIIKIRAAS
jgi:hypothetical protein